MSLFSILRSTELLTPTETLAAAFPGFLPVSEPPRAWIKTSFLLATSMVDEPSPFEQELYGMIPRTDIYFTLDKFHSVEARAELAGAVSSFLSTTSGDVVVTYLDDIVLKRIGEVCVCSKAYADLLPEDRAAWTLVPRLEQPE